MKGMQITQHLHTPYHPQSSGKAERANGVLKNKIAKICAQINLTWIQALPLALFAVRHTPKGKHGLSPFEILFGRPPLTGLFFPQELHGQYASLTDYVVQLQMQLTKLHGKVYSSLPDPEETTGTHQLPSGDWVVIMRYVRRHLEPRFDGAYKVLYTSVKMEGKPNWIHASHCKLVDFQVSDKKLCSKGEATGDKNKLSKCMYCPACFSVFYTFMHRWMARSKQISSGSYINKLPSS
ncbi:LOW QUALITY PROTEIN: uncharacterized protein O3C94_018964 [Discoglossus pictus]